MITIDPSNGKPIYEQIIDKMKENIMKGILKPGDKLPSVRELSVMITANPNTVGKAYKELERMKIISVIRGRGTFVACDYKAKFDEDKFDNIKKALKQVVIEAHYMGIDKNGLIKLLEEVCEDF